jgi:hypothetical protein
MNKTDRENILKSIEQIILEIEDEKISLSKALTKSLRILEKTKDEELKQFLEKELEGKFTDENLPDYRHRKAEPVGVFLNKYNGLANHVKLDYEPILNQAGVDPNQIYSRPIPFSIPEIEDYLKKTETKELMIEFTIGQLGFIKEYLKHDESNGWFLKTAYFEFPFSTLTHILSITQSRLIEILLRIEDELNRSMKLDNEIFFEDGKHFDAVVKLAETIKQAKKEIILVDNYADDKTLQFFVSKKPHVKIKILTSSKSNNARLKLFIDSFNTQYQNLVVKSSDSFHDRFLIIDDRIYYHIGASIKDAGKKSFMFSKIKEEVIQEATSVRL